MIRISSLILAGCLAVLLAAITSLCAPVEASASCAVKVVLNNVVPEGR
jgi:hypothetical protein